MVTFYSKGDVRKAFVDGKEVSYEEGERIQLQQSGQAFRKAWDKLPVEAQDAIFGHIQTALLWRGHEKGGGLGAGHSKLAIIDIAEVFFANGMEWEQYT